jgi:hypothetical protein
MNRAVKVTDFLKGVLFYLDISNEIGNCRGLKVARLKGKRDPQVPRRFMRTTSADLRRSSAFLIDGLGADDREAEDARQKWPAKQDRVVVDGGQVP